MVARDIITKQNTAEFTDVYNQRIAELAREGANVIPRKYFQEVHKKLKEAKIDVFRADNSKLFLYKCLGGGLNPLRADHNNKIEWEDTQHVTAGEVKEQALINLARTAAEEFVQRVIVGIGEVDPEETETDPEADVVRALRASVYTVYNLDDNDPVAKGVHEVVSDLELENEADVSVLQRTANFFMTSYGDKKDSVEAVIPKVYKGLELGVLPMNKFLASDYFRALDKKDRMTAFLADMYLGGLGNFKRLKDLQANIESLKESRVIVPEGTETGEDALAFLEQELAAPSSI